MATATATPLDTEADAKAAKKKEPKEPFNERWLDKKGWSRRFPLLPALVFIIILTQIPFVATLIISFMNWQANYPNEIFFGTLNNYVNGLHRPCPAIKRVVHHRAHRDRRDRVPGVGAWHLVAAEPQLHRPWDRPHLYDRSLPDRAGCRRVAVEARHLQPCLRPAQRTAHLMFGECPTAGLDHRLPKAGDRGSADLVLDPVHDPDPAGRLAVASW